MEVEDVDQQARARLEQAICVEDITQDVQTIVVDSVKPQNGFKLFRRSNPTAAVKIDKPDYDVNGSSQAHKALPKIYLQDESSDQRQSRITQFSSIVMDSQRIIMGYYNDKTSIISPLKSLKHIAVGERVDVMSWPSNNNAHLLVVGSRIIRRSRVHRGDPHFQIGALVK
ncbi:hypothetical protein MP228_001464 [Amoeboaphelidium protococcarum]|nr:hypothetical protein MP228_001464 [Amoeboaphelidium protococcarum]